MREFKKHQSKNDTTVSLKRFKHLEKENKVYINILIRSLRFAPGCLIRLL